MATKSPSFPFIQNVGQLDSRVHSFAKVRDLNVYVQRDGAVTYQLGEPGKEVYQFTEFHSYTTQFISTEDPSLTTVNSFVGDKCKWRSSIPSFSTINLGEVADGISIKLNLHSDNIEKIYTISPFANPNDIKVITENVDNIVIGDNGKLLVEIDNSSLEYTAPIAYQYVKGIKKDVDVQYSCNGTMYGFIVGEYDPSIELVIDPLIACTYLGGNQYDGGWPRIDMALDSNGNILVSSTTFSYNFPANPNSYCDDFTGYCMGYVAKFNQDLSQLLACTFIGGSGDDFIYAMDIDDSNNVYVTGHTPSTNFPTTPGAYGEEYSGSGEDGDDVFIAKLNPELDDLLAATYLGTSGWEMGTDIEVGDNGDVYLTGWAGSDGFPTTENAFDSQFSNNHDIFVARMNSSLTDLVASTYLGGTSTDNYSTIAVDEDGGIFVASTTSYQNYPTTEGAFSRSLNGPYDGAVSHLSSDMTTLLGSTYFGGSGLDFLYYIIVDQDQNVLVSGHTSSDNIPGTETGVQPTSGGGPDGFIIRLSNDLTSVMNATYFGGDENDNIMCQAIDEDGNVFISGYTESSYFPVTVNAYDRDINGMDDGFIAKISSNLRVIHASTYIGGSAAEFINKIAVDSDGNVFGCGATRSSNLPTNENSYDPSYNGAPNDLWQGDAFVVKLDNNLSGESEVEEPGLGSLPDDYELKQCYPNPFNAQTRIEFTLPRKSIIKISVYDMSGRLVQLLENGTFGKGKHQTTWDASDLASGTYLCQLEADKTIRSQKMILIK